MEHQHWCWQSLSRCLLFRQISITAIQSLPICIERYTRRFHGAIYLSNAWAFRNALLCIYRKRYINNLPELETADTLDDSCGASPRIIRLFTEYWFWRSVFYPIGLF